MLSRIFRKSHYVKIKIVGKEDNPIYKFKESFILPASIKEQIALILNIYLTNGKS